MGKSKFQANAQQKVNAKSSGGSRPKYYDEKIKTSSQNPSRISVKSLVLVVGLVALIGGGIFGVGSLLDGRFNPEDSTANPNYTDLENRGEVIGDSGYKMDISFDDIDGTTINLADHAGKVVIFYFHFLECGPCGINSPNLRDAMNMYDSTELHVISVSVKLTDTPVLLHEWADDGGYQWDIVKDTDYSLSSRFGASATPHMAFLGSDGTIEETVTGIQSAVQIRSIIDGI